MGYAVMQLNTTAEVTWMGLATELPLSYADGMVGVIPVFGTIEAAETFAAGRYDIAKIRTTPTGARDE